MPPPLLAPRGGGKAAGALEWGTSLRGGHTDTSSMVAPGDSFERRSRTAPPRAPAPTARPAPPRGGAAGAPTKAGAPAKPAAPWGLWSLRPASFDADYDRLNLSSAPAAKAAGDRARTPASSSD